MDNPNPTFGHRLLFPFNEKSMTGIYYLPFHCPHQTDKKQILISITSISTNAELH